ncbi:MAG: hypothetical protein AB7G47_14075 [Mycolicibacterium sp.]|uniref:hypothetical protein n=1 Tax=Mycolicibacterium sp. TaxID=2320850 RepID=UPI003D13968F
MAWFLALQGPAQASHQSSVYELQGATDVDQLAQELVSAAASDRVVPIPAMLPQNTRKRQKVTLYVRPAAWGMWTFYELSDEDRRQLMKENPLLNAIQQHQREHAAQGGPGPANPLLGGPGPGVR